MEHSYSTIRVCVCIFVLSIILSACGSFSLNTHGDSLPDGGFDSGETLPSEAVYSPDYVSLPGEKTGDWTFPVQNPFRLYMKLSDDNIEYGHWVQFSTQVVIELKENGSYQVVTENSQPLCEISPQNQATFHVPCFTEEQIEKLRETKESAVADSALLSIPMDMDFSEPSFPSDSLSSYTSIYIAIKEEGGDRLFRMQAPVTLKKDIDAWKPGYGFFVVSDTGELYWPMSFISQSRTAAALGPLISGTFEIPETVSEENLPYLEFFSSLTEDVKRMIDLQESDGLRDSDFQQRLFIILCMMFVVLCLIVFLLGWIVFLLWQRPFRKETQTEGEPDFPPTESESGSDKTRQSLPQPSMTENLGKSTYQKPSPDSFFFLDLPEEFWEQAKSLGTYNGPPEEDMYLITTPKRSSTVIAVFNREGNYQGVPMNLLKAWEETTSELEQIEFSYNEVALRHSPLRICFAYTPEDFTGYNICCHLSKPVILQKGDDDVFSVVTKGTIRIEYR